MRVRFTAKKWYKLYIKYFFISLVSLFLNFLFSPIRFLLKLLKKILVRIFSFFYHYLLRFLKFIYKILRLSFLVHIVYSFFSYLYHTIKILFYIIPLDFFTFIYLSIKCCYFQYKLLQVTFLHRYKVALGPWTRRFIYFFITPFIILAGFLLWEKFIVGKYLMFLWYNYHLSASGYVNILVLSIIFYFSMVSSTIYKHFSDHAFYYFMFIFAIWTRSIWKEHPYREQYDVQWKHWYKPHINADESGFVNLGQLETWYHYFFGV